MNENAPQEVPTRFPTGPANTDQLPKTFTVNQNPNLKKIKNAREHLTALEQRILITIPLIDQLVMYFTVTAEEFFTKLLGRDGLNAARESQQAIQRAYDTTLELRRQVAKHTKGSSRKRSAHQSHKRITLRPGMKVN